MPTAEELIVAIKSEGVGETKSDLEGVEKSMEETADSAGDSAEELEGFSNRFQGAMSAAVAALSIGVGGLLTQVPVVEELFSGVSSVVNAVTLAMDDELRPALQGVNDELYDLSAAIAGGEDSQGTAEALRDLGVAARSAVDDLEQLTAETTVDFVFNVGGVTVEGLDDMTIQGFANRWKNGLLRNMDLFVGPANEIAVEFVKQLAIETAVALGGERERVRELVNDFFSDPIGFLKERIGEVLGAEDPFGQITEDFKSKINDLIHDARGLGRDLIQRFINGVKSKLREFRGFLDDLGVSGGSLSGGFDTGGGGGGGGGTDLLFQTSSGSGGTVLDGRQLTESTGRYREDPGRRRGL